MILKNKKNTPISELGEFGLIHRLTSEIKTKQSSTVKGIGDDAAIIDYKGKQIVLTTDLLIEGIHFNLTYTPLKHLGYKAAIVNFSDIYAMNANPLQITVSIAISKKFSVEMVEEIYSGIILACNKYEVDLVGGDTSSSLTGLAISVTALGEINKEDIVFRNKANKFDLICVSGNLGAAYLGLQILEQELKIYEEDAKLQPKLEGYEYILERQLKPEARKDIINFFKEAGIKPTAMIDISDGLSSELTHICNSSDVGCEIFLEKVPLAEETLKAASEFNIENIIPVLYGGEDYELLFTVSLDNHNKIEGNPEISVIGHITDKSEGLHIKTADGNRIELQAQGWDSLSNKKK